MVASVEDPSVINSAPVTVGAIASGLGDWSGAITSTNGTQVMPLDFQLVETVAGGGVTYTGGSNGDTVRTYGPLVLQTTSSPSIPCVNLFVPTASKVPGTNSVSGNMNSPGGVSLSGTGIGTGLNSGNVSLQVSLGLTASSLETFSLTGQFSPDGSTLSGTYTNTGFQAGCFVQGVPEHLVFPNSPHCLRTTQGHSPTDRLARYQFQWRDYPSPLVLFPMSAARQPRWTCSL